MLTARGCHSFELHPQREEPEPTWLPPGYGVDTRVLKPDRRALKRFRWGGRFPAARTYGTLRSGAGAGSIHLITSHPRRYDVKTMKARNEITETGKKVCPWGLGETQRARVGQQETVLYSSMRENAGVGVGAVVGCGRGDTREWADVAVGVPVSHVCLLLSCVRCGWRRRRWGRWRRRLWRTLKKDSTRRQRARTRQT